MPAYPAHPFMGPEADWPATAAQHYNIIYFATDTHKIYQGGTSYTEMGGGGGSHPDLAAHNTLGLATLGELDGHNHDASYATTAHVHAASEAFPIGSVFLSVVSTNPATLLGYGTWVAFGAGKMLVGRDAGDADFDTAEETGGAKTHTLTTAEMPTHAHVENPHNHVIRSQTATTGAATSYEHGALDTSSAEAEATEVTDNATPTMQNAGGGGAHNNMPPYIVVYMWKRTA